MCDLSGFCRTPALVACNTMRNVLAEKVSEQISQWGHRGLIDDQLLALLKARYRSDEAMLGLLLRWLGFFAVWLLGASVIGFIGLSMGKVAEYLIPFVLLAFSFYMWRKGTRMAVDPEQRHPLTGAVLVTVGLIAAFAALLALYALLGGGSMRLAGPILMLVIAGAAFFTAYRYGLRWPLILGVLLAFHALGNMHRYGGHGSYFLGIQDERLTFIIAALAIVFGMWHEKVLERDLNRREVGFGQVYVVTGLLYANLSLWFLSLPRGELIAVLLFSFACIVQIVLGARFHDGRFTGFGIVFLSIDIYTRMFESFWDDLSKGSFFLIAGMAAMIAGVALEKRAKRFVTEPTP